MDDTVLCRSYDLVVKFEMRSVWRFNKENDHRAGYIRGRRHKPLPLINNNQAYQVLVWAERVDFRIHVSRSESGIGLEL